MKKLAVLAGWVAGFALLITLVLGNSVFAFDVSGSEYDSDRVSILGNLKVDKKTYGSAVSIVGNLDIRSEVQRDAVSILGNLSSDAEVGGDVTSVLGNTEVHSNVKGDLVTVLGNATIDAQVNGDVVVIGNVKLTSRAVINGELVCIGSVDKASGSVIKGTDSIMGIRGLDFIRSGLDFLPIIKNILFFAGLVLVLLLGIPVIALFKERFEMMRASFYEPVWNKLFIGMLGFLGAFIFSLLFSWTVLVPISYMLILFLARIVTCVWAGRMTLRIFRVEAGPYGELAAGVAAIALVNIGLMAAASGSGAISATIISFFYDALISSLGIGVLLDTRFGKKI